MQCARFAVDASLMSHQSHATWCHQTALALREDHSDFVFIPSQSIKELCYWDGLHLSRKSGTEMQRSKSRRLEGHIRTRSPWRRDGPKHAAQPGVIQPLIVQLLQVLELELGLPAPQPLVSLYGNSPLPPTERSAFFISAAFNVLLQEKMKDACAAIEMLPLLLSKTHSGPLTHTRLCTDPTCWWAQA